MVPSFCSSAVVPDTSPILVLVDVPPTAAAWTRAAAVPLALAPLGPTHTAIGTGEVAMSWASRSFSAWLSTPPPLLSWMTRTVAPSLSASWMDCRTKSATTGSMSPFTSMTSTWGRVSAAADAAAAVRPSSDPASKRAVPRTRRGVTSVRMDGYRRVLLPDPPAHRRREGRRGQNDGDRSGGAHGGARRPDDADHR